MPYCTPPIVNSWSKKGELPNTSPDRVESPITNRTGDARVPQQRDAERGPDAVVAAQRCQAGARAGETLVVDAVGDEQPRVAIAEDGEPELEARPATAQRSEVRNRVPQPGIVDVDRAGDAGFANRRVGVGDGEVADVLAELPLEVALFPLPEQVRLVETEETAHPRALPDRSPEVDVAGVFLRDPEDDVHVPLIVGGARIGERQGLLEEAEVGDVLVRADQRILAEYVAGEQHDRLADHPLVGDVVARDLDLVHDGGLSFVDRPTEVHHGFPVRP